MGIEDEIRENILNLLRIYRYRRHGTEVLPDFSHQAAVHVRNGCLDHVVQIHFNGMNFKFLTQRRQTGSHKLDFFNTLGD